MFFSVVTIKQLQTKMLQLCFLQTTELGGVPKAVEYLESVGYGFMVAPATLHDTVRLVPFLFRHVESWWLAVTGYS